jgi:hypothetical protein
MRFSQRYGHVPVRLALQIDAIDDGLRNRLWNLVRTTFFSTVPAWHGASGDFLPGSANETFLQGIWHDYMKQTVEGIGRSYFDAVNQVKLHFMQWP